jgi:hypothetical protein
MKLIACHIALLVACSTDPASNLVAISLNARSIETPGPGLTLEKPIMSETGNPYGAFISAAEARLGTETSEIDIERLTLQLGDESTNVTALEQVCTGNLSFELTLEGTNDTFVFGQATNPRGAGPVEVTVTHRSFTPQRDDAANFAALRSGRFKLVLHAAAATDFPTRNAEASLVLTFTLTAL